MEDYWVPGKSDEELERLAEELYSLLNRDEDDAFDIHASLDRAAFVSKLLGLEIIAQADVHMGRAYAYSVGRGSKSPPRIFVRASVLEGLKDARPRDRMTIAHELGHLFVHPQEEAMFRMADGNKGTRFIPTFNSAEHQAKRFAAALLMPRAVVLRYSSAEELAKGCGVSLEAASVRWDQVVERHRSRDIPDSSKHDIAAIKAFASLVPAANKISAREQYLRNEAWDNAKNFTGRDPAQYRQCVDGFPVAYTAYESNGSCGWYFAGGAIYSYQSVRRRKQPS